MNRIIYIDNLQEEQIERYDSVDIEVLTPQELLTQKLEDTDALVVLCELNIDKEGKEIKRTDFYGVKLVQELRRDKFMSRVLFVSFMEEQYIVDNQLGEIIKSIGHSFLRLPSSVNEWKNELETILKLDKLSHYDIANHFSGENAIIGEKIHSIESKIVLKKNLSVEDKNSCIQIIKSTYAAKQKNVESVLKEFDEITDGKNAIEFVKRKCYSLFSKKDENSLEKLKPEWTKWKVLWLDDEETDDSPLKEELEKRGKLKVVLVKTYQEAFDTWNTDQRTTQEICLVIADYRLNDNDGACKKKQGYHFLQYIANKNVGIGLIAYSGLTRRFLFESFKHYGVQVNIFSKIDFNQENKSNIEYLADQIIQLGDNHWMMRNNQPQGTEWEKIGPFYFIFKESINYYSFEQILSKRVRQNLDVFINNFNKCLNVKELWGLTFTDSFNVRNGKFPEHNKGKLKNKIEIVKEILTIRRFAVGLFAFLKSNKNENTQLNKDNYLDYLKFIIYNSDNTKTNPIQWDDNFDEFNKKLKPNPSLKNVVSKPALTFDSSWPYGLLPEEYAWLECDSGLGVTYLSDNKNYWSKIESLRNVFKDNFSKSIFLQSALEQDKISFGDKTVYFNDDYEPFFRSVKEIKGVIKTIYNKLNYKADNYETQLTGFVQLLRDLLKEIEKEESTPANIKTIKTFINTLKSNSKGKIKKLKRDENIIEEYKRLFTPWEFSLPKEITFENNADFLAGVEKRIQNYKNSCLDFSKVNSSWPVYSYINKSFNQLIKEGEEKNIAINRAIYLGIHSWKNVRNSNIEKDKESSKTDVISRSSSSSVAPVDFDFASNEHFFFNDASEENIKQFLEKINSLSFKPISSVNVLFKEVLKLPSNAKNAIKIDKINNSKTLVFFEIDISNYADEIGDKINKLNLSKDQHSQIIILAL